MKENRRAVKILKIVKDFILQQPNRPYLAWYSTSEYETVTLAIIQAFLDTELGDGVGFFEADLIDFNELPTSQKYQMVRSQDERVFWENILSLGNSGQQIRYFHPSFANCFMDEKGLIFALPCYLLWEIEGIGKIPVSSFEPFAKLPLNAKQKQIFLMAVEFLQNLAFENDEDWKYDDWERVKQTILTK